MHININLIKQYLMQQSLNKRRNLNTLTERGKFVKEKIWLKIK